ncbi:MAG: class I SAM-dependent DNA methyltransferase [Chloroflexota bacterium]
MIGPQGAATARALARLYDLDLQEDPGDLDLYRALADRADGPILELAAGTGRLAVPLAAAGHVITAVDIDEAMLDRARERATDAGLAPEALRFIQADLLSLPEPEPPTARYGLAFIALNSIMLLASRDAQRAAIRTLATQLGPGGIAAVDAWLPDADDLGRFDGRVFHEWIREDPASGALVTKTGSAIHDATSGSIVLTAVFDEAPQGEAPRRWIRQDRLRLISADELAAFAEDAGLRVEMVAGGYDLTPLGYGAERAVLIAERP